MPITLSPQTADKIKTLLRKLPESGTNQVTSFPTSQYMAIVRCGDYASTPATGYALYHGTIELLIATDWTIEDQSGAVYLAEMNKNEFLVPGKKYIALGAGFRTDDIPVFITALGAESDLSSGSVSGNAGNSVCFLTDVSCDGTGGMNLTDTALSGYVTIGGVKHYITFSQSPCSGGGGGGGSGS